LGSLGNKLKTAGDLMLTKSKIPFINENQTMKKAINVINSKKLGFLVIVNSEKLTKGVFTDGDLKRLMKKRNNIGNLKIKNFMTRNPFSLDKNTLASDVLYQMNKRKVTNVCIYNKEDKKKTIGILHIHNLINNLR